MSMPISDRGPARGAAALCVLLLAACQGGDPDALGEGQERIACAVGGARDFTMRCTLERGRDAKGPVWMLGHPNEGVRRVRPTGDGRGLIAADGAEPAVVSIADARTIEVAIGRDRYRLPATVKDQP